jgi:hypothetical protein
VIYLLKGSRYDEPSVLPVGRRGGLGVSWSRLRPTKFPCDIKIPI